MSEPTKRYRPSAQVREYIASPAPGIEGILRILSTDEMQKLHDLLVPLRIAVTEKAQADIGRNANIISPPDLTPFVKKITSEMEGISRDTIERSLQKKKSHVKCATLWVLHQTVKRNASF